MARAANDVLGVARCPLCGGSASARLSGKGLAYLVMDCCGAQTFARSAQADQLIRDRIRKPTDAQPAPAPTTNPAPAPTAAPKAAPAPSATTADAPIPVRTGKASPFFF